MEDLKREKLFVPHGPRMLPLICIWEPFDRGRDSPIKMKFDLMKFSILLRLLKWILIETVAIRIDILNKRTLLLSSILFAWEEVTSSWRSQCMWPVYFFSFTVINQI